METDQETSLRITHRLWVARHDISDDVAKLALKLWEMADMQVCVLSFLWGFITLHQMTFVKDVNWAVFF